MATQILQQFNEVDLIVSDIDRALQRLRETRSEGVVSLAGELQKTIDEIRAALREG